MKWWLLLAVAIIAAVCAIYAIAFFLSGAFLSLLKPPVDISGINVTSYVAAQELLPVQLINGSLKRGTVTYAWTSGFSDGGGISC
jgi:hypothetical protein